MNRFATRIIGCLVLIANLTTLATATLLPPKQTGNFYVGDFANARVVVYDASGALLDSFTAPGLSGPRGIVVLQDGTIYVASQGEGNNPQGHLFALEPNGQLKWIL